MRPVIISPALVLALLLAACTASNAPPTTQSSSGADALSSAASSLIKGFIWQADDRCGYHILRPENWEPKGQECPDGVSIYLLPDSEGKPDSLVLSIVNYQVLAQQDASGMSAIAQYELFKQDSSLDGWTAGLERMWPQTNTQFTLEKSLANAKIYAVTYSNGEVGLSAFVIDNEQPLALTMNASGVYASLERLHSDHLWDDFVTMVSSMKGVDPDEYTPTPF